MSIRKFKIPAGRALALPHGLQTAPGAMTMRVNAHDIFELDSERCQQFQRFIAGRLRAGDLIELDANTPAELAPATAEATPLPPAPVVESMTIPTVPTKETR
jgi:hypothetical protein